MITRRPPRGRSKDKLRIAARGCHAQCKGPLTPSVLSRKPAAVPAQLMYPPGPSVSNISTCTTPGGRTITGDRIGQKEGACNHHTPQKTLPAIVMIHPFIYFITREGVPAAFEISSSMSVCPHDSYLPVRQLMCAERQRHFNTRSSTPNFSKLRHSLLLKTLHC